MQSNNNTESNEVNIDKIETPSPSGAFTFGKKIPVTDINSMNLKMAGGLQFGTSSTAPINQQIGPSTTVSGAFGFGPSMNPQQNTIIGGCCRTIPPNTQRHPETGLPIQPQPQQNLFGIRTEQPLTKSRDKIIDELYSELRTLREHVNESNKLIGNIYELLRKV